jgi:hypothetical protein
MTESIRWNGQKITTPGIYRDVPLDDYHRGDICDGPSVSSSTLRDLWNHSPAHAWARSAMNPNRIEEKDSEHFILGRATHHLICGEVGFAEKFVIRPDTLEGEKWNGNRKDCKKWIVARHREGKTILTWANVEAIKGMAVAIGAFPLVQQGALNGQIERSFFWRDRETGWWLKARPDDMPNDSGDFTDLKSTVSVLYRDLQSTIGEYGYHQQGALIMEGAQALGIEAASFTLIFVEKAPPHCVRAQQLRDEDIARGGKMNRVALRTFVECFTAGVWPGPGDGRDDAEYVDLADWRRKQIDERLHLQLSEAA